MLHPARLAMLVTALGTTLSAKFDGIATAVGAAMK
jgi:hypothetical protein